MLDWNKKRLELMGMSRLIDGETNLEELKDLVSDRFRLPHKPCDEVVPKIFVGGERAAKDPALLKTLGITHIINCASTDIKTGEVFYMQQGHKFTLLTLDAKDDSSYKLTPFFEEANRFIEVAMHTGGKVLVHSVDGISRAPTIVIAYLMMRRGNCALGAVRTVRGKRHVKPNDGFLQQICDLDQKIRREQQF